MSRQRRAPDAPSARIAVSMPSHTSFPSAPVTRDSLPMLMMRPSPFGRHSHGNENAMHARSASSATVRASSAKARNISSALVSLPRVPGHTALLERFRDGLSRLVKADASGAQIRAAGIEHENALARARRARRGKERRQHHQRRGLSAQTGAHVGDVGVRQILKGLLLIEHVVSPEKFFGGFLCTHSGLSPVRARFPASGM